MAAITNYHKLGDLDQLLSHSSEYQKSALDFPGIKSRYHQGYVHSRGSKGEHVHYFFPVSRCCLNF